LAVRAALERSKVLPKDVSEVFMGCVLPAGLGQAPARQAAIEAGVPISVPATTVNKVCGSGLQTIILGAQSIMTGSADVVVAGGMESMSNAPHLVVGARTGQKMGPLTTRDHMVHDGLWDPGTNQHMGSCAELCAREQQFSRKAQDEFAAESYRRAQAAQQKGLFAKEIVPVPVQTKQGESVVSEDEEPKRGVISKLGELKTAFDKAGTITAGNASSLSDGAAAVVLCRGDLARSRGLPVLARIVAWGGHAQDPVWFSTAPAPAIKNACNKAGWKASDVDLWEVNEAFAVVSLAINKLAGLDPARVNVHGGAIALGHPIGATGARLIVTLLHALAAQGKKTGGAALCIGGGEGLALLVERA
jgi:acetyl-CoA C-acetyltransferase